MFIKLEKIKKYDDLKVQERGNNLDFSGTEKFLHEKLKETEKQAFEKYDDIENIENYIKEKMENLIQELINENNKIIKNLN